MYLDYFNAFVFVVTGLLFVFLNMFLGSLVRPHHPTAEKLSPYECGEEVIGDSWIRFDIRFYTTALIYLVFAVEIAFLFLGRSSCARWGSSPSGKGVVFLAILFLGLAYVWIKGDLDWVKSWGATVVGGSDVDEEPVHHPTPEAGVRV